MIDFLAPSIAIVGTSILGVAFVAFWTSIISRVKYDTEDEYAQLLDSEGGVNSDVMNRKISRIKEITTWISEGATKFLF